MKGITHGILGVAAGVSILTVIPAEPVMQAAALAMGLIGGLISDIDHPKAIISRYTPGVGHAARLVISHRGPTHSLLFLALAIVAGIALHIPQILLIALATGIASHLLADMATVAGVPLLWPLQGKWRLAPRMLLWVSASLLEIVVSGGAILSIGWNILETMR
jgi:membrane-bound metal-dependent hydrolase YbcI (DUF457 family)